jgi:BASS family bile acid:Na+ symporter
MYGFFQDLTNAVLPVFVIATMFNVGLTQNPSAITANLRNWHFLVRMLFANFIIVPSLMFALVNLVGDYEPAQAAGLMIMSVCAGAPFLIKLTQTSENDIALGATVMMVLMVATVIIAPVMLPFVIEGLEVDAWGIAQSLFLQMLLPIIVGMILAQVVHSFATTIQPWVARIGNLALYVVLGATIIGYWPERTSSAPVPLPEASSSCSSPSSLAISSATARTTCRMSAASAPPSATPPRR